MSWVKMSGMIMLCIVALVGSGCKTFDDAVVVHDELFTYDVAYGEAYYKALTAIEGLSQWKLMVTEEGQGSITVMSKDYMCDDQVVVLIKSLDKKKVSVELAPESQTIKGADDILKAIDKQLMQ